MVIVSGEVSSKRRRILLSVVGAVVAVSLWFAHSREAQGRREAAYQVARAPFKRDLPIGRRDVRDTSIRGISCITGSSLVGAMVGRMKLKSGKNRMVLV